MLLCLVTGSRYKLISHSIPRTGISKIPYAPTRFPISLLHYSSPSYALPLGPFHTTLTQHSAFLDDYSLPGQLSSAIPTLGHVLFFISLSGSPETGPIACPKKTARPPPRQDRQTALPKSFALGSKPLHHKPDVQYLCGNWGFSFFLLFLLLFLLVSDRTTSPFGFWGAEQNHVVGCIKKTTGPSPRLPPPLRSPIAVVALFLALCPSASNTMMNSSTSGRQYGLTRQSSGLQAGQGQARPGLSRQGSSSSSCTTDPVSSAHIISLHNLLLALTHSLTHSSRHAHLKKRSPHKKRQ